MSAMKLLPENIRQEIMEGRAKRDDLAAIVLAEVNGWKVTFRNDQWRNCAGFERGAVHIWHTGREWRIATLVGNRFTNARSLGVPLRDALQVLAGEDSSNV